jgi:hypothetical protein
MDTAIAGLLGVVAGAVVTGAVQSLIARSDRRLSGRVSARLLHATVIRAVAAIQSVREAEAWDAAPSNWDYLPPAWEEHRVSLARVLSSGDFFIVSNWFSVVDATIDAYHAAIFSDPPSPPTTEQLKSLKLADVVGQQVQTMLSDAGRTWRDRSKPQLPPDA